MTLEPDVSASAAAGATAGGAFSHLDHGTAEALWAAQLATLPTASAPGAGAAVLVVAAHPDDETLGAGGLIATAIAAGARVEVVIASNGSASHPRSPTHSPDQLTRRRRQEADEGVAALGAQGSPTWLDLPDGSLGDHVDRLAEALADCARPDLIVAPWLEDGHPDHAAAARAAQRVAQATGADLWQYPIWAWHWADPSSGIMPTRRMRRLPLARRALAAKDAAIAAYTSQHRRLSPAAGDEAVLSAAMLAHFRRGFETFVVPAPAESAAYFDELYRESPDPWGLGARWYERRKRDLLLAALPRPRFRRIFEPGCALGHLSARLAERADELVAWDASVGAVDATRAAMHAAGARAAVAIERGRIPADWPDGAFDLIVLSEVGYYCADLALLVDRIASSLTEDGVVVACHWRHPAADHPQTAEAVHEAIAGALRRIARYVDGDVLLEVFGVDGRSVAQAEALVPNPTANGESR